MKSKSIVLIAGLFYHAQFQAQQSQFYADQNSYRFGLAENLYQSKIYNASQYEFARQYFYNGDLSASKKEAARFFDNVIGVILKRDHAEQGLQAFLQDYPNSAYFAQANLPLADYYLGQKDFAKALETLQKVNQYQLSREENTEYILKLGYAKFMTGDSKGALQALEEAYANVQDSEKKEVAYMLGHLYYADHQNEKAFQYFDEIKDDPKFARVIKPYYVQLYFNEKNYPQAIAEGNQLLNEDLSDEYKREVHKIIGESYFMQGDYASAYPHLKIYADQKANFSDSDLYEMGFVAAQIKNYEAAVNYYNQLINSQSATAQNAYYQLGNAYLQTGKKQEALAAYRSSAMMNFDASVQELAYLQYAKLSYDIGNPYESAPVVLQKFIKKYPNNSQIPSLKKLLIKSYLYSGNYKQTLVAIDQLPNSSPETDKIDQEVSYLLGTEEFNKGNYTEAEKYLLRSLENNQNKEFTPRALYWLAQTYYQQGNYPSAIARFEKLKSAENFPEKKQLSYDLGYAYFKNKNFKAAQNAFEEYLKNPKPEFLNDAKLRLGDTYYANNQLNEAIAVYDETEGGSDYSSFQKAMALGFKGDSVAKIAELKKLISTYKNSDYIDDAQYEIATAYASNDDFKTSNDYFSQLISTSKDADLIAKAEIYRAQNEIDLGNTEEALTELKKLGRKYQNTAYAEKIVQAARPIFIKNGDVAGYQKFASDLNINIDAAEIDEFNLTTAKQLYAKKDFKQAIGYYEKYLTQNPTGENLFQAIYELGESYFQTKNLTKALLTLQEVANVQNDYQEDARTRMAQIYLSQGNSAEAKSYLLNLVNSSNANLKNYAQIELMKIFAEDKDYNNAEKYADLVLTNQKNSAALLEQAQVVKARVLMEKGRDKEAQAAFSKLEKSSNAEVAAEALYAKALYQNKAKAYKNSNETIFKLANNYASEEFWGAKSLVLLAKNYLALKDNYQASYTCDQIIENYKDFPEIIAEAKEVKKMIKK